MWKLSLRIKNIFQKFDVIFLLLFKNGVSLQCEVEIKKTINWINHKKQYCIIKIPISNCDVCSEATVWKCFQWWKLGGRCIWRRYFTSKTCFIQINKSCFSIVFLFQKETQYSHQTFSTLNQNGTFFYIIHLFFLYNSSRTQSISFLLSEFFFYCSKFCVFSRFY